MVSIRVDGANRVANRFRSLAAKNRTLLDGVVGDFAKRTRARLKSTKYPPKRPNQKYKRTGRLANSWRATKIKPAVWAIENTAQAKGRLYAIYVVGPKDGPIGQRQAWMHKGRWWRAGEEIQKYTPELRQQIIKELKLGG